MTEPGVNLSRLVAAERNAESALRLYEQERAEKSALAARVTKLEAQLIQNETALNALKGQFYASLGNVRTA